MNSFKTQYYRINDGQNKITSDLKQKCSKAYRANKYFFGKNSKFFNITIANNEEEFKNFSGRFYQKWVKGVSLKGKNVYVRSLKLYDETYKKFGGTAKFEMLLTHEINHIFASQLNLYSGPIWFTEGLAMYVAGQVPGKTFNKKTSFTKKKVKYLLFYRLEYKKLCDEMYVVHYYAIKYLLERFGKQKLLQLIYSYSKKMKRRNFEYNFKKIFGITYNDCMNEFVDKFSPDY